MARIRLAQVIAVSCLLVFLAAILFPMFAHAKMSSYRGRCLSNCKQLAIAEILYAGDWDDHWGPRDTWMDDIGRYVKYKEAYRCPVVARTHPDLYGYAYNSWLESRPASATVAMSGAPMIYDSINLARNASDPFLSFPAAPRERERNAVCFADSHVRAMGSVCLEAMK